MPPTNSRNPIRQRGNYRRNESPPEIAGRMAISLIAVCCDEHRIFHNGRKSQRPDVSQLAFSPAFFNIIGVSYLACSGSSPGRPPRGDSGRLPATVHHQEVPSGYPLVWFGC